MSKNGAANQLQNLARDGLVHKQKSGTWCEKIRYVGSGNVGRIAGRYNA